MYYKICEDCGAWLDVGERCDCKDVSPPTMPATIKAGLSRRVNEEAIRKENANVFYKAMQYNFKG